MIIYIDPGHGGVWPKGDPGVVSQDGEKIESYYNWIYANALQDYLQRRGVESELTRDDDVYKIPYSQRTHKQTSRDLMVSIHFDTYLGGKKLIYYSTNEESKRLAESVDRFFGSGDLRSSLSSRFNGLYIDDADCPAILIEVDRIDRASLEKSVINAFCEDVYLGIKDFIDEDIAHVEDASGEIEGDKEIKTEFTRVFLVSPENESVELPVERMNIVGDKLYIAPEKEFFED